MCIKLIVVRLYFVFFLFLKLKLREKLETSLVIEGFKDITIQYYSSNQFSLILIKSSLIKFREERRLQFRLGPAPGNTR